MRLAWVCIVAAGIATTGLASPAVASHRWDTETELSSPEHEIRLEEPDASGVLELELVYRYPSQAVSVFPSSTELALGDPTGSLETALVPETVQHNGTNHPSERDPGGGLQQEQTARISLEVSRHATSASGQIRLSVFANSTGTLTMKGSADRRNVSLVLPELAEGEAAIANASTEGGQQPADRASPAEEEDQEADPGEAESGTEEDRPRAVPVGPIAILVLPAAAASLWILSLLRAPW